MIPPVRLSARAHQTADQPISYFMQQAVENPNLISLAAGLVDQESLPAEEVKETLAEVLGDDVKGQAALQYGTTQGFASLRDKLLARATALDGLKARDLSLSLDDVVVTTGSQQLLYLLGELLLDPGDIVITEAPSYFVYHGTLNSLGVRTLSVPMDDEGMDVDALAGLLNQLERAGELERVRMVYVCDYFQNPTGLTLSLPRRRRLLELVQRYSRKQRIVILEDAAYRELRYDGGDLPSIKSLDHDNAFVILAMTFSKPLAPGLKTGYGILPRDLAAPLLRIKGCHDFGSNNLTQHLIDRLLENGAYDRHVEKLRQIYRHKRDTMLDALVENFPASAEGTHDRLRTASRKRRGTYWTHPDGGLYVWLSFPPEIQTGPGSGLMQAAIREGLLYVPGEFCYVNGANGAVPRHEARLSFGVAKPEQIHEAIRRLASAAGRQGPPSCVAGIR